MGVIAFAEAACIDVAASSAGICLQPMCKAFEPVLRFWAGPAADGCGSPGGGGASQRKGGSSGAPGSPACGVGSGEDFLQVAESTEWEVRCPPHIPPCLGQTTPAPAWQQTSLCSPTEFQGSRCSSAGRRLPPLGMQQATLSHPRCCVRLMCPVL